MAGSRRAMKQVTFDRSEGGVVTKTVEVSEGARGLISVWQRCVAGETGATLTVYGTFSSNPTEDELFERGTTSVMDNLDAVLGAQYGEFPFLAIKVEFVSTDPSTVEVYLVSY